MHHDVRAVLNGADEIGRAEGVVDHERQAMPVSNFGDGVDVRDIGVGVAQRLKVDGFGVGSDGGLDLG